MDRTSTTEVALDEKVEQLAKSFDHLDPALNHEVLESLYRRLAGSCPVTTDAHGGFTLVIRHPDVVDVEKNCPVFSSAQGVLHPPRPGHPPSIPIEFDAPEHTAYRKLFMDVLSAPQVRRAEPYLRDLSNRLLDAFVAGPDDDFVKGVASQLPIRAVGQLLGWGEDANDEMQTFADTILEHFGTPTMIEAFQRLGAFTIEQFEARRREPRDDYLTKLVHAEVDGRPITDDELLNIVRTFVFAGYETTARSIAGLVAHLAKHPELQEELRNDPSLINNAVEEGLRVFAPVHTMFRTVTEPTELDEIKLDEGDRVVLLFAAANRDPAQFENPHQFDLHRENARQHLAFGIGPHYCAGAPLARTEMRILLEEMLQRPPFELTGEPVYLSQLMMGQMMGIAQLPLRFTSA